MIEHATAGIDAGRWKARQRLVENRLRRRPELTDGQRQMVRHFATSGNVVDVGIGPAGSGKTAVMALINQLAAVTGTPIVGAALAARTAAGLQTDTGIPSTTVARLLNQSRHGPGLPVGAVVVVDEAGMVGTRQLAAIVDLVEAATGKLILIGDDRQLPEIDAGGLFRALANRLPHVALTENVRQREAWERDALTELRHGSIHRALDLYRRNRRLFLGRSRAETIAQAVADWYHHVERSGDIAPGLLIAHDNDTVADLNRQARTRLAASGRLHGPALETNDMTLQAGDRILCRHNHRHLGVLNGDRGTVTAVDQNDGVVTVQLDRDSGVRQLPRSYLEEGHVDYGYALTAHKAQGITTDGTYTVITTASEREWTYVAMSRGRSTNTLYITTPEQVDPQCTHLSHLDGRHAAAHVASRVGRSAAQVSASEQRSLDAGITLVG